MIVINKNRLSGIAITILFLLSIPFIAMQFTSEVNWSLFDFVIMGALLSAASISAELILSNLKTVKSKLIACGTILFLTLAIWAELAVGIFGSPFAGS